MKILFFCVIGFTFCFYTFIIIATVIFPVSKNKEFKKGNYNIYIKILKEKYEDNIVKINVSLNSNGDVILHDMVITDKELKKLYKKGIIRLKKKDLIGMLYFFIQNQFYDTDSLPKEIKTLYRNYWRMKKINKLKKKKLIYFFNKYFFVIFT